MAGVLAGQRVLVTGGSRGIGLAVALRAREAGASVVVASRRAPSPSAGLEHVACDVADAAQVAALHDAVGPVDVLVNAAGIAVDGLLVRTTDADITRVLAANLSGAIMTTRAFVKTMLPRRRGCVLFVSSAAALRGSTGQSVYSASKAGLLGFSASLAHEVASRGIRVNAIAPGFIDTDMTKDLPAARRTDLISRIPLGRFGRPDEVADAALFLMTASYVTGQVLVVDGGLTSAA